MINKTKEQRISCKLRAQGQSINQIAKKLKVSKSSVSVWVKDVKLSHKHILKLKKNSQSKSSIKKRRESRLRNEQIKRDILINKARGEIGCITRRELWVIGTMLYWAEGGKTQRMVRFSNGDPEMIKVMMRYFMEVCGIPISKIHGYIHIHEHLDFVKAESYWQKISGIPDEQFYKTYRKSKTKSKRKTLPYGVMDIYIMDVKLFLKIKGWTAGVFSDLNLLRKL